MSTVLTAAAHVAACALLGAYLLSFWYRQRGDDSSPGGTQPARFEGWAVPVAALCTVLAALWSPGSALLQGVFAGAAALLGVVLLPHGAFQALGQHYQPAKWPIRVLEVIGSSYGYRSCIVGLALFGVGRLALLLAVPAFVPLLVGDAPHPWLLLLSFAGVLQAAAYAYGWARGHWANPLVSSECEIGEFLWGAVQGLVVGGGLGAVAVAWM